MTKYKTQVDEIRSVSDAIAIIEETLEKNYLNIIGGIFDLFLYQFIVFRIRFALTILFSSLNFPG